MRDDDAAIIVIVFVVLIILAIALAIQIFFLLNVSRCLALVRPRNRDMEPGLVWLNLIPCLNLIWSFMIVLKVASSLRKEYEYRRWPTEGENFGSNVGLGWAICVILANIPYIGILFGIPGLICFIMYWVQIANYRNQLQSEPPDRFDEDEYDDRFERDRHDDAPPKKLPRYEDDEPDDRYRAK